LNECSKKLSVMLIVSRLLAARAHPEFGEPRTEIISSAAQLARAF
jgi:hypothetical protein